MTCETHKKVFSFQLGRKAKENKSGDGGGRGGMGSSTTISLFIPSPRAHTTLFLPLTISFVKDLIELKVNYDLDLSL
jgi:hypothetical protein